MPTSYYLVFVHDDDVHQFPHLFLKFLWKSSGSLLSPFPTSKTISLTQHLTLIITKMFVKLFCFIFVRIIAKLTKVIKSWNYPTLLTITGTLLPKTKKVKSFMNYDKTPDKCRKIGSLKPETRNGNSFRTLFDVSYLGSSSSSSSWPPRPRLFFPPRLPFLTWRLSSSSSSRSSSSALMKEWTKFSNTISTIFVR